ncbi:Long-chain-fatty-acid--CoA ligase [Roseivivax sp. THAF40]|uniref:class I adenylate-forming enzyme family protein n=1 Tax=unclassified Roseivivax TaxID=2639302 RepID=UPI001267898E|nr:MULTISPECIES: class I adenylate-forming enzyme family protein [unclassified Roseivivax]QFS81750.1 Long-chain-fatty-acid--CoA ligase [Roseivivax sp. THAF197b]QFT45550.1 Long-chain-fatty-acid--CoA ligase [Roseivivax sp. THAF40]
MTDYTRIHQMVAAHAAARPDAPAMIDADGTSHDWKGYDAAIDAAADLLVARGVTAGDRVLIVAENCFAVAALVMACSRLDAWALPVNARMSAAEIDRIAAHAEPRVAVYTSAVSKEAALHAQAAGAAAEETGFGAIHVAPLTAGAPEPVEEGTDQVAVILYTTGTTGAPKGVMLTHGNLLFAAAASRDLRNLTPDDHVYGALPLTHVFGLASMLMASAMTGCQVELATRFSAEALYQALKRGATVVPAVPQMHAVLMAYAAEHGHQTLGSDRLRYVSSGAAPLDPAWKRKAEAFYGLPLQNGYGMTETTAGVSGTRNAIGDPDTSVGPPLPGVTVKLDETVGNEPGVGEVLTAGPHIMKGYYKNPEATAAALTEDGFMRTGDLGQLDDEGRLHIVGRSKELIIRGGFNVYPPEVEAALNDHPAVVQSAVIGRKVAGGNEEVLAFCQITAPGTVDASELGAFVAARLSGYKRPSHILIVDALPAAATGKILKHKLLETFGEELDAIA